jgi:hypothetical protein
MTFEARAQVTGMHEEVVKDDRGVIIIAKANVPNPLQPGPAIDYRFVVKLTWRSDEIAYDLTGTHDGFPAYSVFIGNRLVYGYDPTDRGASPWALWGSGDHPASARGCLDSSFKPRSMCSDVLFATMVREARSRAARMAQMLRIEDEPQESVEAAETKTDELKQMRQTVTHLKSQLSGPCPPEASCTCPGVHRTDCHDPGYDCGSFPHAIPCRADFRCRARARLREAEDALAGKEERYANEREERHRMQLLRERRVRLARALAASEMSIYNFCAYDRQGCAAAAFVLADYQRIYAELMSVPELSGIVAELRFARNPADAWMKRRR